MENKSSLKRSLGIWLPLAGLIFGSYCGGASISGAYAVAHFIPFGGGHLIPRVLIFVVMMSIICSLMLRVIHNYNVSDYKSFYLALYGLQGEKANPILKKIVTLYFDFYTILVATAGCAPAVVLFTSMVNTFITIPAWISGLVIVALFAFFSLYGTAFLRKFDSVLTIALIAGLLIIFAMVLQDRGAEFGQMFGNFEIGLDWSKVSLGAGYLGLINFAFTTCCWGSTLANHSEVLRSKRDCYGSGIAIGISVGILFFLTSAIVLPYMPEAMNGAPILSIAQEHLAPWISVVYWALVLFAILSTGPIFCNNMGRRFSPAWKSEKVSPKAKQLIISLIFLTLIYCVSFLGMMNIVVYIMGAVGLFGAFSIGIPLVISIFRKDHIQKIEK